MKNCLLLTAALLIAGCSEQAETENKIVVTGTPAAAPSGPAPTETRGQEFVSAMLGGLDFALAGGRQVVERGEPATARQQAQKLVADLSAAREELVTIAQGGNLKLAPMPGSTDQTDLAVLSSTRGEPLAKAFAAQQMNALTLLVGTMRAYKNGGDNPALRTWAEKHQGPVNERLLDIQTLNAELEGES